jgi:hypothetical protein
MRTINNIFVKFFIAVAITTILSVISGAYHQALFAVISIVMALILHGENHKTTRS